MSNDFKIEFEDSGIGYIAKVIHDENGVVPFFKIFYVQEGSTEPPKEILVEWNKTWLQKIGSSQTIDAGKSFIDSIGKEIENYYAFKQTVD